MKNFIGPISFRKRDKAVKTLVRRGHATDDELFEAQFGEWPANGLDKANDCSDIVHFKGFYKDIGRNLLMYPFRLGYTRKEDTEDRTIYLNGLLLSSLAPVVGILSTRFAYARIHDIVGLGMGGMLNIAAEGFMVASLLSSYRYAAASSLAKLVGPSLADVVGEEQIHIKQFKEGNLSVARAAFQYVAADWLNNQSPWTKSFTQAAQVLDSVLTLMPRFYYSSDYELQARLHNVIVRGYSKWGKIPETKDELYVALQDMGILMPKIAREYYEDPAFDDLKKIFDKHSTFEQSFISPPNAEMNIGLNSFRNEEILEMYWRDCLPLLYGDLLQKYGDPNGLEKMGFTQERDVLGMPIEEQSLHLPKP